MRSDCAARPRLRPVEEDMTDLSIAEKLNEYKPANKVRFVTAASLFDGHDASINIMRRILMANGAEVIHLGHNRSVEEIVTAALNRLPALRADSAWRTAPSKSEYCWA